MRVVHCIFGILAPVAIAAAASFAGLAPAPAQNSGTSFSSSQSVAADRPASQLSGAPRDGGAIAAAVTGTAGRSSAPPAGERRFAPDEVVIELDGTPAQADVDALARRHNLVRIESRARQNTTVYRWRIPDGRDCADVIRELEADNAVRSAQPNYVYTTQDQVSDPGPLQYANVKLHVAQAQQLVRGEGIRIAVIDSGIDVTHPELAGDIAASFDAIGTDQKPHAHGTAVAGLIVAHAQLTGVAPAARILAIRAFVAAGPGSGTTGTTFSVLKGLDWAIAQHAQVINMSFSGPADPAASRVLAEAAEQGIVLVAAAGNAGPRSPPLFPADDPNVIAVAATDADDHLFRLSTPGPNITVAAPGVDLVVAVPNAHYDVMTGTSFAAPLVSGVVALMLARNPALNPKAVRNLLMATAVDLGSPGRDDQYGAGLTDAFRAVEAADPKTAGRLPPTPTAVH